MKYEIVLRISEDGPGYDKIVEVERYTLDERGIIHTESQGKMLIIRDWVYIQEV